MRELIKQSKEVRDILISRGFLPELSELIAANLNTEYTAGRMLGYLGSIKNPSQEELVDEMLAILSDRDRFVQKHVLEANNMAINELYYHGLGYGEDDDEDNEGDDEDE